MTAWELVSTWAEQAHFTAVANKRVFWVET